MVNIVSVDAYQSSPFFYCIKLSCAIKIFFILDKINYIKDKSLGSLIGTCILLLNIILFKTLSYASTYKMGRPANMKIPDFINYNNNTNKI